MKYSTLLYAPITVDGGNNAPSGTLTLDNDDSGNVDNESISDASEEGDEPPPQILESPIEKKIETSADKKAREKSEGKIDDKTKAGDDIINLDDLQESNLVTKESEERKKRIEADANKKIEQQKAITDNKTLETDANKRDYSLFSEEEKVALEKVKNKLPNEAFNILVKNAQTRKQLETDKTKLTTDLENASKGIVKLPDSYIEHPDAWKFHPEVQQIGSNIQLAKAQIEHYSNQLDKIEAGEDWETLLGLNEDGSFNVKVVTAKETTSNHKRNIERIINQKDNELLQFNSKLGALRNGHVNAHKELTTGINNKLQEFCPWIKEPKLQDNKFYKVTEKGELIEMTIKQEMEESINRLPANLRNNVLAPVVQQLQVGLALERARNLAYEAKDKIAAQNKVDTKAAEPKINGKAATTGAKAIDNTIPKIDDMNE